VAEPSRSRRLGAWAAVLGWSALILTLSGESFSAEETGGWLVEILGRLAPGLDADIRAALHFAARKGAHVVEYGVLAVLTFHALRTGPDPRRPWRAAALALAFVTTVAVADESRQARLPDRTGTPRDVALDVAGGGIALGLALGVAALRRARQERPREPHRRPR